MEEERMRWGVGHIADKGNDRGHPTDAWRRFVIVISRSIQRPIKRSLGNKMKRLVKITLIGGTWWLISRFRAFHPTDRRLESRSSCHVYIGTLGKSLTRSCLWSFGVKFRHSIRAVSGAPLSSRGLEEAL